MVKLFTNKELAQCLGINPARWKRWSREFLPPDPLAGRQSGYARQYYFNDAFTVYLGGHLVAALRLAIPEARQVLADIEPWLRANGYRFDPGGKRSAVAETSGPALRHTIVAYPAGEGAFAYRARGVLETGTQRVEGVAACRELYLESWLNGGGAADADLASPTTIPLSRILEKFLLAVDPRGQQFPQLH